MYTKNVSRKKDSESIKQWNSKLAHKKGNKAMFSGELTNMVHGQTTTDGEVCQCGGQ